MNMAMLTSSKPENWKHQLLIHSKKKQFGCTARLSLGDAIKDRNLFFLQEHTTSLVRFTNTYKLL